MSLVSYEHYLAFNGFVSQQLDDIQEGREIGLSGKLTKDNIGKALLVRGLPYGSKVEDILKFFNGFGKLSSENVIVEINQGRRTG